MIEQKFYSELFEKNNTILELIKQKKELQFLYDQLKLSKDLDNGQGSSKTDN